MSRFSNMKPLTPILIVLPLLMTVSIIELSFVSAMVGFLHGRANGFFVLDFPGQTSPSGPDTVELWAKPTTLIEDQGHTSNGAAGTGFVLIGFGGLFMVWWERRRMRNVSTSWPRHRDPTLTSFSQTQTNQPGGLYLTWLVLCILGTLLTLAALIYTFVVTNDYSGQTIDLSVVAANPAPIPYPLDDWTPENWFQAVLDQMPLQKDSDRSKLRQQLHIMRGWRWNLVPFFIVFTLVSAVGVWEYLRLRRMGGRSGGAGLEAKAPPGSF
jgi:hypothetical protein